MASETDQVTARAVEETIARWSLRAAKTALQPIPLVDGPVLTTLQLRMLEEIARLRDRTDEKAAHAAFHLVFPCLLRKHLAMAGLKLVPFVPVVPELVSFSMAYALTYAVGEVADDVFRTAEVIPARLSPELTARFDARYRERFSITYRERRDDVKRKLGWKIPPSVTEDRSPR